MAVFHAFRALRPTPEKAADVAALPYDVVNREEAKSIGDENPLSFLHIDRPEMDLEPETDLYDDRVYEKSKKKILTIWKKREFLFRIRRPVTIYITCKKKERHRPVS